MVMPEHVTGHPRYQNGYPALMQPRSPMPTRPFPPAFPPPGPVLRYRPPRRDRRRTAAVLAALATAFLLSAGVFAALFVAATGDHDAAADRLAQRHSELADLDDRISAKDAERQRTERHNGGLESEDADLTECVGAMRHYLLDGLTGAARVTALDEAYTACH
jgi:hypothetical protein